MVKIDQTLPTSTRPTATLNAIVNANGTVPFTVDWSAGDAAGGSGLEKTFLQQRLNGGTYADVSLASNTATAKVVALHAGDRYQFRTRSRDVAGNQSQKSSTAPWNAGASFLVSVVQDNAATGVVPTFSGNWVTNTGGSYFGGTTRSTFGIDQIVSVTFTGTEMAWISTIGPSQGTALVTLDGVETVVDLYALLSDNQATLGCVPTYRPHQHNAHAHDPGP